MHQPTNKRVQQPTKESIPDNKMDNQVDKISASTAVWYDTMHKATMAMTSQHNYLAHDQVWAQKV